jgi:hypothetical protein
MYASYDEIHLPTRNVIRVPVIWVAIVLSLLVHLAAMWEFLPHMRQLSIAGPDKQGVSPLAVRLAAPPGARTTPASPEAAAQRAPAPMPPLQPRPLRATPAPTVMAAIPRPRIDEPLRMPPPAAATPSAPTSPLPPPPVIPVERDLSAYIAARRQARGEPEPTGAQGVAPNAPPVDDDRARRDRIVADNLASVRTPTFGGEPRNGGGLFQLRKLGLDEAEFMFFGWNKDIARKVNQRIVVERGNNPDIRIAVVRRIITIIRDQEKGDFRWQSLRLGRDLNLSARAEDTAELEAFMLREFFESDSRPR